MFELFGEWLVEARRYLPFLVVLALTTSSLAFLNFFFRKRLQDKPDLQFRFQLVMLCLTLVAVLAVVIALPVSDTLRGQLLGLIGILLSAAIALSSTTFIGNILAGIMMKAVRSARPGDWITVGDLTGRIVEMNLLHSRVQTEFRDLVTVPNLFMVTRPLHVVRASGTIIHTEVSLGYDVHHARVNDALLEAAKDAGLKDAFVHVRSLGDFSVNYRVAGLLEDVQSLLSTRSKLCRAVLDAMHAAGIEIVSPTFMNTRAMGEEQRFMALAEPGRKGEAGAGTRAEDVAFDVADEAASVEELRRLLERVESQLNDGDARANKALVERLEARREYLEAQIEAAEKEAAKSAEKE